MLVVMKDNVEEKQCKHQCKLNATVNTNKIMMYIDVQRCACFNF